MSTTYTVTNVLTTIFTPPASCASSWTYEAELYNSVRGGLLIQNALEQTTHPECFPTDFAGFGRAPSYNQIYSPGACPSGYRTAGNNYNGATTTAVCCPSDFSYTVTYSSINYFSSSAAFEGCVGTYPDDKGPTTVAGRSANTDLSLTVVSGPLTMWAQPISVAFDSKDVAQFTATSASISAGTSAGSVHTLGFRASKTSSSESVPSKQTANQRGSTVHHSNGISTGTIAGIAMAAVALLAVLVGLAVFFYRRSKRTAAPSYNAQTWDQSQPGYFSSVIQPHWPPSELQAKEGKPTALTHEMPATQDERAKSQRTFELGSP